MALRLAISITGFDGQGLGFRRAPVQMLSVRHAVEIGLVRQQEGMDEYAGGAEDTG